MAPISILITLLTITLLTLIPTALYRLTLVLNPARNKPLRHGRRNPSEPIHLLIVLGSGGHTAEMLAMLTRAVTSSDPAQKLNWKDYHHRTWVISAGDSLSAARAKEFEEMATPLSTQEDLMAGKVKKATDIGPGTYEIVTVPRAREIHQGLATVPVSGWKCLVACRELLTKHTTDTRDGHAAMAGEIDFPDLILCNGPATATVLVGASVLLRFFDVRGCSTRGKMRTVYVESWARVKRLSLSGRLLSSVVDRFLVQWPQLAKDSVGRIEYRGVLV
ncbi:UDP-N-acetylglucosamine transferase subunit [Friedmanniomyces endolithicus]|uniref:UDP-N-acetylglucosamine transferase subunit ALG14 n=1 Tax=Friedmanniomyces endolithicus TaxID=329885 RepID=A0A4U0VJ27_9PEZI|nr:UDP-N-acetylglucosamine transferase subunit [Friedmanniomyces endolithicus]KAK0298161.1 UDP-N-acetylglucosamine transferase subunit [Friedmanniomyces endolithicus]KAK0313583.1 UDP-N-acetylglucosamine transferase subunit [Friedmanniomyces endolithicus]KAK0830373.1 UDP-N-acetylglucosamine transferase subunit [Friedmanniomyces endolithicus]KAK0926534.1 UDP-N-acetylglucosamine transferase subunit [Friedmanniomyces endolithicus]